MRVENAAASSSRIEVRTTGAVYRFDLETDSILARQRLVKDRPVATWQPPFTLKGLQVLRQSANECILASDAVTIGIQCDSMMFIVPHGEGSWTLESQIGGEWNRLVHGHLVALDTQGGFSVNPDIPLGSGRLAKPKVLTEDLDFVSISVDRFGNTSFVSDAKPGWRVAWQIRPGERLAFGVCPPRPFPWKESFERGWTLTWQGVRLSFYDSWKPYIDTVVL
jgi:hypothetical protein